MRTRFLLAAILAGSSLLACSVLGGDAETLESDHTEGEPTFAQHAWLWADETEEEFKQNAEETSGWGGTPEFLPTDHPMTERLQFWIDRMDEAIRAAHPDKLSATPRPRVLVKKTEETNAWVSFMPVAWNVRTRMPPLATDGGAAEASAASDASDGGDEAGDGGAGEGGVDAGPSPSQRASALMLMRNGSVETRDALTFERPHNGDQLDALTKFFNANFSKCTLSMEGEELVFGDGCTRKTSRVDHGDRFAYYATAKFITFTSGYIMQLLDEDRIVSTLAHELGHYYRSHANMPTDVVNYFYSLDGAHAHKPAPDPRYLEHTAKAREKLQGSSWYADWSEENALMAEKNLGFYTIEQEADEIALELMSKVGVPPGVAVDKVLNMLKAADDSHGGDAIGWTECAMLREHGWKDADGKAVSVPVGDPSNAHHNLCFRAFNMSREIGAHRYAVAERPTPPGEPWSRLLTRLAAEVDPLPPPPPPDDSDAGADDAGAPADAGTD